MPVTLAEAVKTLESGHWCSLRYFTANTTKGSGGKVMELLKCKIARQSKQASSANSKLQAQNGPGRDPQHRYHFTRNIELQNRAIRTVYPILITHINGKSVL